MRFFPYNENDPFNGILFNSKDEFHVDHSTENVNANRIPYLYDKNPNSYSCLKPNEYNYYQFIFHHEKIKITGYSIQSYKLTNHYVYPKQWVLSAFDGKDWFNISTVADSKLTKNSMNKKFETDKFGPFSEIKFTQIGDPYTDNNEELFLCMSEIEFYGSIGFYNLNHMTCLTNRNNALLTYLFIFLI